MKYKEHHNKHKYELIARDETIKAFQIKLSEASKSIETMKIMSTEIYYFS